MFQLNCLTLNILNCIILCQIMSMWNPYELFDSK